MKNIKRVGLVVLFVGIAFLPALGAVFVNTGGWYAALTKPLWDPPSSIFAPVWTVLYFLIGLAGYFQWTQGYYEDRRAVFTVYGLQLFFNALWTPLFFGLHRPDLALADIVFLWFLILICIGVFSLHSRVSAWLMVPYFLWVSFACALNTVILMLN